MHTAGGRLDPQALTAALPRWAGVSVLADDGPSSPSPQAVAQVIEAGQQIGPVVLDLARWVSPMRQVAIQRCSLVVLLSACDVSAITAAHRVVGELGEVSVVMVARGTPLAAGRGARLIAVPLAGRLAARRRRDDSPLIAGALGRAGRRIADGVLDTVGVGPDRALAPDHGDAREASGGGAMSRAVLTGEASTAIIARPKRRVDS